jgi:hypothetical protein
MQAFNRLLPKKVQKLLVTSSAKKIPFMGFVVEPYSFFLCYEIADIARAKSLLPDGFTLIKTSIFDDDEPKYYCILSCFRSHTSAFWGTRAELYVIAEDQKTGLLSWIIVDYDTDTIRYDSQQGLRGPTCSSAILTVDYRGTLFADIRRDDQSRQIIFSANVTGGTQTPLNQRLWLEGNLSVGYGRVLSENNADIFSLKFEPGEVEQGLRIPYTDFALESNTWYPGLFSEHPAQLVCFPYAQHFISDSPGSSSNIRNKAELVKAVQGVDFDNTPVYSTKSFRTMFLISGAVSLIVTVTLIVLLIVK